MGPLACSRLNPFGPVATVCPVAPSVSVQAWRFTSPPPPLACTLPPTVSVSADSWTEPPPSSVPLLSALISPGTSAVSSALRKTPPPPHESLLTSIGLLDRVTLPVPMVPSVTEPPQLPLPLPGTLSAALTMRSPVGSMSMVPPPPPPVPPGRSTCPFTVTDPLVVKLSSSPPSPPPSLLFWLLPAAFALTGPSIVTAPCTLASRMI